MNRVGVLALQGDFAAHARAIHAAGAEPVEVRRVAQLSEIAALIVPGGESTSLLRLMERESFDQAISAFHDRGGLLMGTCAGLILFAREVLAPSQQSLGLLDVTVERNAFGRQAESFVDQGRLFLPGHDETTAEMVFIRAPRIRRVGPEVRILGEWNGEPVLVQAGRVIGGTFHPELSHDNLIHTWLVEQLPAGR